MRRLLSLAAFLVAATPAAGAFAQTATGGSAYLPYWICGATTQWVTTVWITNTSATNLTVGVTFYGRDGATITSGVATDFPGGVLPAGNTGMAQITCSTTNYGVAAIRWSGGPVTAPLLAYGVRQRDVSGAILQTSISVNGDQPF